MNVPPNVQLYDYNNQFIINTGGRRREFVSLKEGVKRRERLPHYMVPKMVVFKDELPKTSMGIGKVSTIKVSDKQ